MLSTIIQLAALIALLYVVRKVRAMAHTLDETLAAVQNESTVDDSIIALLKGIKAQLDAITAGALPPAAQAQVDAIFDAATANSAKVADAVTANTPVAPTS